MYDTGLPSDSTVSAVIRDSKWAFPITQTIDLNEIRNNLTSLSNPNMEIDDHHKWSLTPSGQFTISSMWERLRTHFPKNHWHKCVWFSGHIPKCSLISWVAIQNRQYTEDRLVLFGTKATSCCSFCPSSESHNHLFFQLPLHFPNLGPDYSKHRCDMVTPVMNKLECSSFIH